MRNGMNRKGVPLKETIWDGFSQGDSLIPSKEMGVWVCAKIGKWIVCCRLVTRVAFPEAHAVRLLNGTRPIPPKKKRGQYSEWV